MKQPTAICPSILAADFSELGKELDRISHADAIHIDIMDGHFVPNISFGPMLAYAVRKTTNTPLDIHLMVTEPEAVIMQLAPLKPEYITVHYESCVHLQRVVSAIRANGSKAGVALNPHTPIEGIKYLLADIDLILVMSVNPGYGGQQFISSMLTKIADVHQMIQGRNIRLQVDGGVTQDNVGRIVQAGADMIVAGSAIFTAEHANNYIDTMRKTTS